ncbi:hypothetical protein D3C86_1697410 [compost metagenome]
MKERARSPSSSLREAGTRVVRSPSEILRVPSASCEMGLVKMRASQMLMPSAKASPAIKVASASKSRWRSSCRMFAALMSTPRMAEVLPSLSLMGAKPESQVP